MWLKKLLMLTATAAIALGIVLGWTSLRATQNFAQLYVFGDSLSDVGNVFEATKGDNPPSPPYFQGHYSNGPVWVEYLAQQLKLTINKDMNFASGGATTGGAQGIPPGLLTQINSYTATVSSAQPQALYLIWAGANDYLGGDTDFTVPINNLLTAVKSLLAIGAKNIYVVNLPDLGKLPGTLTTQRSGSLTDLTNKHNYGLATALKSENQQLSSEINLRYLDVNALFYQVSNHPQKFGLTNVTDPCLIYFSVCADPNKYLFWDSVHPTTIAHKLLVELAFKELKQSSTSPIIFATFFFVTVGIFIFAANGVGLIFKRKKAITNRY